MTKIKLNTVEIEEGITIPSGEGFIGTIRYVEGTRFSIVTQTDGQVSIWQDIDEMIAHCVKPCTSMADALEKLPKVIAGFNKANA